jgi:hypothetical protein
MAVGPRGADIGTRATARAAVDEPKAAAGGFDGFAASTIREMILGGAMADLRAGSTGRVVIAGPSLLGEARDALIGDLGTVSCDD